MIGRRDIKQLIPIACGQVIFLVFGLVSVKIISHLVSPAVYGFYSLFLTLVQVGMLLTHAGLYNYATRCWHREHEHPGPYARFLWSMNLRAMRPLAILLLVVVVAVAAFQRDALWLLMFPLLLVTNLSLTANGVAAGILTVDDRRWLVCGLSFVSNVTRTFLPAVAAIIGGASMAALGVGYTAYAAVLLLVTLLVFRPFWTAPSPPLEKEQQWLRELSDYSRPYLLMGVGGWFLQNADRWIVLKFFGEDQAGWFALAANLGVTIPGMVAMSMLQLVFPRVFREADQARELTDWKRMARFCDWLTFAFLTACVLGIGLLSFLGPHLVGVLIDRKYDAAMQLLLPVGMSAISIQVNQFYYLLLQGQQNSAGMVRVMLAVSAVKTIGSIVTASISWKCFLVWLGVSMLISALIGRTLIRSLVFQGAAAAQPGADGVKSSTAVAP